MKKLLFTLLLVAGGFVAQAQDSIQQAIFTDDEGSKFGHVRGDGWDDACYADYTLTINRSFVVDIAAGTYHILDNVTGSVGTTRPIAADNLAIWTGAFGNSNNMINNVFPLQADNTVMAGERAIRATN